MAEQIGLGSNGWAFGRDVTTNKSGLLLGNPHFPWETTNRFYEVHLTIPGKFDAMGVTIAGAPGLSIGFNKDVAWTHTVSTDRHFTLFELALDPADPTAYLVDGKRHVMDRKTVSIDTPAGPQTRTYFTTLYGPVVVMPQAGRLGKRPIRRRDHFFFGAVFEVPQLDLRVATSGAKRFEVPSIRTGQPQGTVKTSSVASLPSGFQLKVSLWSLKVTVPSLTMLRSGKDRAVIGSFRV